MPMIGTSRALAISQTMRRAMGLIAGPHSPPVRLPRNGARLWGSSTSARSVLTSDTASAPAPAAARATETMSVTFGVSLTMTRRRVRARAAAVRRAVSAGSVPIARPPLPTLGHDTFSS